MSFCVIIFFILLYLFSGCKQNKARITKYPKVDQLIENINNSDAFDSQTQAQTDTLGTLIEQIENDSVKRFYLRQLSNIYFNFNKYPEYYKRCHQTLKLSIIANDSLMVSKFYRDLGDYHFYQNANDSAYYYYNVANKWFKLLKVEENLAYVLMQKARLNLYEKNYTQSEVFFFEALGLTQKNNQKELSLNINISLGNLYLNIKDYDQSKKYFNDALNISNKNSEIGEFSKEAIYNNLGLLAIEEKDYEMALNYFKKAFSNDKLKKNDPNLYAAVLSNQTRTRFELGQKVTENDYFEALNIRSVNNNTIGQIESYHDLGEYHIHKKDSLKAKFYYKKSLNLAHETKYADGVLKALRSLSRLFSNESINYQNQLLKLTDSLYNQERIVRNKFAKTEFETDQIIIEKEIISTEKKFLTVGIIASFLLLSVAYLYYRQRLKANEFFLIQEQQKANEEVYNLLITQQNRIADAKNEEKNRISRELHDGIQSKLTGIRLNLSILKRKKDIETIDKIYPYIEELKNVENEIREISHDLRTETMSKETFNSLLEELVITQNQNKNYKILLKIDENIDWENYPNITKVNLYRIAQESLQNIFKYAQCKNVELLLYLLDKNLILEIKDDGIGFKNTKTKKGIGIKNMEDRVKMLEGEFTIEGIINKGTHIVIKIPYNERKQS
jgi:signal transduction histidine kinase